MPSRTLTLFELYYLCSVLVSFDSSTVHYIMYVKFNSSYQDLYRILWKITKILLNFTKTEPSN